MMMEGKGIVPPKPVEFKLMRLDLDELRSLANDRERRHNYKVGGTWKRGLVDEPTLIGLVGEHMVVSWLNTQLGLKLTIDTEFRKRGDDGVDVTALGSKIQVKTKTCVGKPALIKRIHESGRPIPMLWDCVVIASWEHRNGVDPPIGYLHGFQRLCVIEKKAELAESNFGCWKNLVITDGILEPMSDLLIAVVNRTWRM